MFHYGYCDLSINIDGLNKSDITSALRRLREYGFRTVALNVTIGEENFKKEGKKKGKQLHDAGIVPAPFPVENLEDIDGLTILNRLTVCMKDSSQLYQLRQSVHFNKYHLFAVIPLNQNMLQQVCGLNDVDIISFQPESKSPYRMSRKLFNTAVEKKIFFEIPYAPTILDTTCRRNVISTSHLYFTFGRSRNVVITSSSTSPFNSLRSPYDIVHLGLIFGLNDVRTKEAITKNCTELIYRADGRRRKKSFLSSFKVEKDNAEEDQPKKESNIDQPRKKIKLGHPISAKEDGFSLSLS